MDDQRTREKSDAKNDAIEAIVTTLEDRGLNDPRKLDGRTTPRKEYVRSEVSHSWDNVRLLVPDHPKVTAAAMRQLGKLLLRWPGLRQRLGVSELWAEIYSRAEQEPPEGADGFKHRCADEAFYLLENYTERGPTGEAMQTIASLLHGGANVDMERACKRVLRNRRKFPRNNPDIPPLRTPS
jgi:hypothetical protein